MKKIVALSVLFAFMFVFSGKANDTVKIWKYEDGKLVAYKAVKTGEYLDSCRETLDSINSQEVDELFAPIENRLEKTVEEFYWISFGLSVLNILCILCVIMLIIFWKKSFKKKAAV